MTTLYDNPLSALLDMIERCAPKLMKSGGGPLVQDAGTRRTRITKAQREEIIALARAGHNTTAIRDAVGCSATAAWKICHAEGIAFVRAKPGRKVAQ